MAERGGFTVVALRDFKLVLLQMLGAVIVRLSGASGCIYFFHELSQSMYFVFGLFNKNNSGL